MVSPVDFYSILQQIAQSGHEIRMLNVYKGLPISNPGRIVGLDGQGLHVATDRYQTVCLFLEKHTYIQSPHLPYVLFADVRDIDIPNTQILLTNLAPVMTNIGDRAQVRVEPREPLRGAVQSDQLPTPFSAELADLSQDGLAFYVTRANYESRVFTRGNRVTVYVRLPGIRPQAPAKPTYSEPVTDPMARFSRESLRLGPVASYRSESHEESRSVGPESSLLKLPGLVTYSRLEANVNQYRVGLKIQADPGARSALGQFIAMRQSEIIREIKEAYDLLVVKTNKK